jgi:RimJ/RimL family protein N-acetyltransferase
MWAGRGFGRAALYEKAGGSFVGRGGLHYWSQFDEVEVGWALRAGAWGHGYASEAGAAWIEWAFAHLDVPYVTACIDLENHASVSVARRLGMSVRRTDVLHGRQVSVFAIDRPERPGPEPATRP